MTTDEPVDPGAEGETEAEAAIMEALAKGDLTFGDLMNACGRVTRIAGDQALAMRHLQVTRLTSRMGKRWRQFYRSWNDLMSECRKVAAKIDSRGGN